MQKSKTKESRKKYKIGSVQEFWQKKEDKDEKRKEGKKTGKQGVMVN